MNNVYPTTNSILSTLGSWTPAAVGGIVVSSGVLMSAYFLKNVFTTEIKHPSNIVDQSRPVALTASESTWSYLNPLTLIATIISKIFSLVISPYYLLCWIWKQTEKSSHTGAGVLPYCIKNNEVYFLLSKEGFGPSKNTWCDFGGARDRGETVIQTAAREGWEESRDILGDKKSIENKISSAPSIGSKTYKMFFMRIENPTVITNDNFTKNQFTKFCRMEKSAIAWIRADDVFKSVMNNNLISTGRFSFYPKEKLRGFFAKNIYDALNNPQEKRILESICNTSTVLIKQAS